MKTENLEIDGGEILLVDKPAGVSSFGVVAQVRRQLGEQAGYIEVKGRDGIVRQKRKKVKVGHTGTLDPFATGLLILLVGKGTKRAGEFLKLDKEYIATIRLGEVSSTGDLEGEITPFVPTSGGELRVPSRTEVEKVVAGFVREIEQRVPNFSAVKINGQRAYKLARAGKMVEMPVRKVRIYEIEILGYEWPELMIRCKVSSGTYIRALGEDIGKALGVGGYLTSLRRTQVGEYKVDDAEKRLVLEDVGIGGDAREGSESRGGAKNDSTRER